MVKDSLMRIRAALVALILATALTGCGVTDLAKQAADATACKALDSTIKARKGIPTKTPVTTTATLVNGIDHPVAW